MNFFLLIRNLMRS